MTRRDVLDLLAHLVLAAYVLVMGTALPGCGPSSRTHYVGPGVEPGAPAPRVSTRTARGVQVDYPAWLDLHPALLAQALREVDTVTPEPDTRIDPALRGVPLGARVVVTDARFWSPSSPTGLAAGEQRGDVLYVAWRPTDSGPVLPALPHEVRHLLSGDPLAGHVSPDPYARLQN